MPSSFRGLAVAAVAWCSVGFSLPLPVTAQVDARGLVTCQSSGGLTRCPAGASWRGARLINQISRAPCLQGKSWGFDARGIRVDKGCRGEFNVGRGPAVLPPPSTSTQRIICGAPTDAQVQCNVIGYAASVRIARELNPGRCQQNASWGYTALFIWVNKGCRADFEVTLRGETGPGAGTPGTQLITCGVTSGQYAGCTANGQIREVRLMRDVSGAGRCAPPQNWGHSNVEIWTRNGCRGEFQVTLQDTGGPTAPVPPPAATRVIPCGLVTGQRTHCQTGGYATGARLTRDFSGGRCRQGQTWGYTDSFIWTNTGCRAEFEATYRGGVQSALR
ncbi:MAG: DUF3011 domain-containing protein [Gemmatimonadales bacterium]